MRFQPTLLLLALAAPAAAGPKDHTGADACGACHPAILASWKTTAHARASDASVLGARARDGVCLSCHATARLAGVQCEACHGPGAAYSPADVMRDLPLARALGLRDAAASCKRCHVGSTTPRAFDFAREWARIRH
jgi:hypothetical protein